MHKWIFVGSIDDIQPDSGECVKIGDLYIAVFNYQGGRNLPGKQANLPAGKEDKPVSKAGWYAVQNICPHKNTSVLSRGLVGDEKGEPKVACPLHKNTFSLRTGTCLSNGSLRTLKTYPVRIEKNKILIGLSEEDLKLSSINYKELKEYENAIV